MTESKVVEAVGVAAQSLSPNGVSLSKKIEAAMSQAVLDAIEEGLTEAEDIKAKMMEYRQKVLSEFKAAEARWAAEVTRGVDPAKD